jgi:hypothetical protein
MAKLALFAPPEPSGVPDNTFTQENIGFLP